MPDFNPDDLNKLGQILAEQRDASNHMLAVLYLARSYVIGYSDGGPTHDKMLQRIGRAIDRAEAAGFKPKEP